MSFRELRSFVETMRLLGYPNLISMESFRNPNVELVADCLFWLIKRYEPSAEIVYEIEREGDRIFFFKQICEVALAKGQIKLNIKKLYQSDGNAVQEMLILASVLKKAMNATEGRKLTTPVCSKWWPKRMYRMPNVYNSSAVTSQVMAVPFFFLLRKRYHSEVNGNVSCHGRQKWGNLSDVFVTSWPMLASK
ncbi:putative intraflagellar transport protein A1 [Trypanosoma cruzi]|uniref:Putative intraflagellar transport protein A1 n=1 Tax=Trypanosoma cruzi TaxID=5693 RepID=A0A2V2UTG1_TRYCR|nr:putative intraflagellar transport protein A1 [Trypanosoma cruzi]